MKAKAKASARCCKNLYRYLRVICGDEVSDRAIARRIGMEWKSFANPKHGERDVPGVLELLRIAKRLKADPLLVLVVASGLKSCGHRGRRRC